MLKVRVIPTLLHKTWGLVKGVNFDSRRAVGSPMQAIKVYNLRNVDELAFLDVTATAEERGPDFDLIDELADDCFMPLAVGGGIRSVDDVRGLLSVGADKVVIGTAAIEQPEIVREASARFGAQCVVVAVDTRGPHVYVRSGTKETGRDAVEVAVEMERLGAGEILLQSIDQDGIMNGYDIETITLVSAAVSIPVIASGGAGHFGHMVDALGVGGASAVAAASIFHFTEQTPVEARDAIRAAGFPVRW
ncbi:MAG: imidazole glycerol phosphate synthase subunit HisF [Actinomycetota bacterium]